MADLNQNTMDASAGSPISNNPSGVANSNSNPIKASTGQTSPPPPKTKGTPLDLSPNLGERNTQSIRANLRDTNYLTGFEDPLSQDLNEIQAYRQSAGNKLLKGVGRVGVKAIAEVAKIPGLVVGGAMALGAEDGEGWNTFVNNEWIKGIQNANDSFNDAVLPVYTTKAMREGNLWDNVSSAGFWATDGADGLGYILSMLVPGAALKSLNLGSRAVGGLSKAVGATNNLFKGTMTSAEVASGLSRMGITARNIDNIAITMANTFAEAGAEAGGAMSNFEETKSAWIENQMKPLKEKLDKAFNDGLITEQSYNEQLQRVYEENDDHFNLQKGNLGRNIFGANVAILVLPNFIQTKLLFGGAKGSFDLAQKKTSKTALKGFMGGVASEGFFEEGLQTTAENMFTKSAEKNQLGKGGSFLNDFNLPELFAEYGNTLTSTEGQKAIFLGAAFGGIMNGKGAVSQAKNEYAQALTVHNTLGNAVGDLQSSMANLYQVDDKTGNLMFDKDNNPVLNPIALKSAGQALSGDILKSALYENIIQGNTDINGDVDVQSKNALDFLRKVTSNSVAVDFALFSENGEAALESYLKTQREAIVNDENLDSDNKRVQLMVFENTKSVIQKQFQKANNSSEAYDTVSPALSLDTSGLIAKNSNQIIQNFQQNLKMSFVKHQGNVSLLKDIYKEKNEQFQKVKDLLPEDTDLGTIPALNVIQNEIYKIEDTLADLEKQTKDLFLNKEAVQNLFNENVVGSHNIMAQKEAKSKLYTNIVKQISDAKTIKEVDNVKLEDPLFKEEFDKAIQARKKEIRDALEESEKKNAEVNKNNETTSKPTEVEIDEPTSQQAQDLMTVYEIPLAQANRILDEIENSDFLFDEYIEMLESSGIDVQTYLYDDADHIILRPSVEESQPEVPVSEHSQYHQELLDMVIHLGTPNYVLTEEEAIHYLDMIHNHLSKNYNEFSTTEFAYLNGTKNRIYSLTGLYSVDVLGSNLNVETMNLVDDTILGTDTNNKATVVNETQSPVIYKKDLNNLSTPAELVEKALVVPITNYTKEELYRNLDNTYNLLVPTIEIAGVVENLEPDPIISDRHEDEDSFDRETYSLGGTAVGDIAAFQGGLYVIYRKDDIGVVGTNVETGRTRTFNSYDTRTYSNQVEIVKDEEFDLNYLNYRDTYFNGHTGTKVVDSSEILLVRDLFNKGTKVELEHSGNETPIDNITDSLDDVTPKESDNVNPSETANANGHLSPEQVVPIEAIQEFEDDIVATTEYQQGPVVQKIESRDTKLPRIVMGYNSDITAWSENPVDKTKTPLNFSIRSGSINTNAPYENGQKAIDIFNKGGKPSVEEMEFMVMYLPLTFQIPTEKGTMVASVDGYRTDMSLDNSKENRPNGTYNSNSASDAMALRFQMIDAMLNNKHGEFKPHIESQLGGTLRLNKTEDGTSINSNIRDLKLFAAMSPKEVTSYLKYNLFYINGLNEATNEMGIGYIHSVGAPGDIFLKVKKANGEPFMLKLNQGNFTEFQAESITDLLQIVLDTNIPTDKTTLTTFTGLFTADEYEAISGDLKEYFDIATKIYGKEATIKNLLNLMFHNSTNAKTRLLINYGSMEVGTLFGKGNQETIDFLGGRTSLQAEDFENPSIREAFKTYLNYVHMNVKKSPLSNDTYINFLLDSGHLTTNATVKENLFGNVDKQSVTEVLVGNTLKDSNGDSYVAQFDASKFKLIPKHITDSFIYETPQVKTKALPSVDTTVNDSRNIDLFPDKTDFGKFDNEVALSRYDSINGVGYAQYINPKTGTTDVYITGTNDNNYVAYMRQYEDGQATNTFTSKMDTEGSKKSPVTFKEMLTEIHKMLPEGHKYTEDVSVSTDGLRFFLNQLKRGYSISLDSTGKPEVSKVYINGGSLVNDLGIKISPSNRFNSVPITNAKDLESVISRVTQIMKDHGISDPKVYSNYGTVAIELPVIQKDIVNGEVISGLTQTVIEDSRPVSKNGISIIDDYLLKFEKLDTYGQAEALLAVADTLNVEITEEFIENLENPTFLKETFSILITDKVKSTEFTKQLDEICGF